MKSHARAAILLVGSVLQAHAVSLEDVSPHLSGSAQIIWKAPTNSLPKTLWTYQKQPQIFSAVTVSNALLLGNFKLNPFPKSFTKPITIWDDTIEGDPQPDYFAIEPNLGFVTFRRGRRTVTKGETSRAVLIRRTWQYAAQLGIDKAHLVQGNVTNSDIALSRKLDGIPFQQDSEGFSVQYGDQGEIRFLTFNWPKLERAAQERVINSDEITRCIRAFKTPVFPANDEPDYLGRVKALSTAKAITITNITLYYGEGEYGKEPNGAEPEKFVEPVAVLDAVADWGNSNAPVSLFSPLIESDANRLLRPKTKPSNTTRQ